MSDIAILTKDKSDGERLKKFLRHISDEFSAVSCITPESVDQLHDCKYIFSTWYMPVYSQEEIKNIFPNLQCIFYAAGTVKYFAEPFLNNGIRVFSAASANGVPVAEFTAAQIILANKGYYQAQRKYRNVVWPFRLTKAREITENKAGNYGSNIGIIGCGAIGSMVIKLLRPYKLNIFVYDPYVSDEKIETLGAKRCELNDLFRICDVISNHLPDIESTRNLIDYRLLSQMKPWATFINTGRGRQIVEKDLAKVMRKNKGMCALLDVTAHEPLFPWSPLLFCKNIFRTPHIAGSISNEFGRMVQYMIEAYHHVLSKRPCQYEVSIESLKNKS